MKINTTAQLIGVEGDQEEFADMIGTTGQLCLNANNNWYSPDDSGDSIELIRKRVTRKDDKVRVHTRLGNVFIFRLGK